MLPKNRLYTSNRWDSPQFWIRKIYSHARDQAVLAAVAGLSRRTGWKPSEKTLRKLLPKSIPVASASAVRKQAQKVAAENAPEDDSWLRLGEQ